MTNDSPRRSGRGVVVGNHDNSKPPDDLPGYGARQLAGHQRRRDAAARLSPLAHSGRRDPLSYREIADCVERGKAIAESGRYVPARGEYLGTIEHWCLDVYDGSPQDWKDMLIAEIRDKSC